MHRVFKIAINLVWAAGYITAPLSDVFQPIEAAHSAPPTPESSGLVFRREIISYVMAEVDPPRTNDRRMYVAAKRSNALEPRFGFSITLRY